MTSSKPTHLPMAPPPDTIISGCRASAYELGGGHKLSNLTHKFEYNETVHQEGMEKVVVMKSTVIETLMA